MPKQTIRAKAPTHHLNYIAADGKSFMSVDPSDHDFLGDPKQGDTRFIGPVVEVIRVGWSVEHGVQLVLGMARAHDLGDFVHVDRTPDDPQPHAMEPVSLGVDLDRSGINDVIRALRTARDRAFGRDE